MSVTYLKNAAAASLCDKIGNVILDRTINDLIFGLGYGGRPHPGRSRRGRQ